PMRLWSSVTSQLATRPLFHDTGQAVSALTAIRSSLVDVCLHVGRERLHLRGRPRVADRGHLDPALAHALLEPGALDEERALLEIRAVSALAVHAVARCARAHVLRVAEVRLCCGADVGRVCG